MQAGGITFDFHNTLFSCDDWFQLEIRDLVPTFLTWLGAHGGPVVSSAMAAEGRRHYLDIRAEIKVHGQEQDAASCVDTVLDRLDLEVPRESVEAGVHQIMAAIAVAQPMTGALAMLRDLTRLQIPLGIVSSAVYQPFLERSLRAHGLSNVFAQVTTSAGAGFYKTRPEIYWHAAEAMGLRPATMVHVGDSLPFDVGGALQAGFRTVWISYGRDRDVFAPQPDLVLESLSDSTSQLVGLLTRRSNPAPARVSR